MTEDKYNPKNDPEDAGSTDDEIADALSDAGYVDSSAGDSDGSEAGEESDSADAGGLTSKLSRLTELSGTGESLDSYENDPIAAIFDTDGEGTHKGAKHIARGVDGLSPLAATNPLIDIGVGFVLLSADDATGGALLGDDEEDPNDPDSNISARDAEDGGDMLT
jgi:hypothetical protein